MHNSKNEIRTVCRKPSHDPTAHWMLAKNSPVQGPKARWRSRAAGTPQLRHVPSAPGSKLASVQMGWAQVDQAQVCWTHSQLYWIWPQATWMRAAVLGSLPASGPLELLSGSKYCLQLFFIKVFAWPSLAPVWAMRLALSPQLWRGPGAPGPKLACAQVG